MNSKRLLSSLLSVLVLFPAIPAMASDNGNAPVPSSKSSVEGEEYFRRRSVVLDNLYNRFLAVISKNKMNVSGLECIETTLLKEWLKVKDVQSDLGKRGMHCMYSPSVGITSVSAEEGVAIKEERYATYTLFICEVFLNMAKLSSGSNSGMSLDEAVSTFEQVRSTLPHFENVELLGFLDDRYKNTLLAMVSEVRKRLTITEDGWVMSI